ncbi:hypothetical protein S7335_230 [Synechococcus sp. PCC 7335]|nr:hypothetical protein [Synechococcus sp. PCC 7335]EDX83052.1 hypothetical protein S7335_230 [Synechococcus sp. PCC 7335]
MKSREMPAVVQLARSPYPIFEIFAVMSGVVARIGVADGAVK